MAAHPDLSIVEAVETLSSIADLSFDRDIGVAQKHEVVLAEEKVAYKTVHWLHKQDAASTVKVVREIFRVILHYLKEFYKNEYRQVTDQKTMDEIKTIMVLVGEAVKKLDKYTEIFHQKQRIADSKEYQQLQEFYHTKIARQIDDDVLSKWMKGLSLAKSAYENALPIAPAIGERPMDTRFIFIDLETVKKDTEYELFYIHKADGSNFFSSRLLRNIKLVCDFGSYFGERKELDPLESIREWMDLVVQASARGLVKSLGDQLTHFYQETRKAKEQDVVELLHKALFALLMSSHSQNLIRHQPIKSCAEYFEDFQGFLRDVMQTRTYQKWLALPPKESNRAALDIFNVIRTLCRSLYVHLQGMEEMRRVMRELLKHKTEGTAKEHGKGGKIWQALAKDYTAIAKIMTHHPNGPLLKVLEILEENSFPAFDPISQNNLPNQLYDLDVGKHRYVFLRIPAPVIQEAIDKAIVNDEFKGFIRACYQGAVMRRHLLVNLQDRTSWREQMRCKVLEELPNQPSMGALAVVTLATDTDFYHQLAPYHNVNGVDLFLQQFKKHLLDDNTGYFFSSVIDKQDLSQFIDSAFQAIHRLFFSAKNVLHRESRMDFISLFYLLLELKLMEWTEAETVSLTCKDSIDCGEAESVALWAFLKLISGTEWSAADREHMNFLVHAPALLIRERVMLPNRFNRMLSTIKAIETKKDELGAKEFSHAIEENLAPLYKSPIWKGRVFFPK